jgi:hypothetical protein
MKTLLWLDDERNPTSEKWYDYLNLVISCLDAYNIVWVKSYLEFVEYINSNQLPEIIWFDNDLGDVGDDKIFGKEGYDCAKYLSEFCIKHDKALPEYIIQSSNPVAKLNIFTYLENHKKYFK